MSRSPSSFNFLPKDKPWNFNTTEIIKSLHIRINKLVYPYRLLERMKNQWFSFFYPLISLALILILSSCGASRQYEATKISNTITSYENYLAKYAKSKYAESAKKELDVLYEEKDWKDTRNAHSISAYEDFNIKYTNSKYTKIAKQELAMLYEERDWGNARSSNSINGFENFIAKYPGSKYLSIAKRELAPMYEERDWKNAKGWDTMVAYKNFITKYPQSPFITYAEKRIGELEEQGIWNKALSVNTISGYNNFISTYPKSKYVFDAKNRIESLKDAAAWEEALQTKHLSGYKKYIALFPNGNNRAIAQKKIQEIEVVLPAWKRAVQKNTPAAYKQFMDNYYGSSYYHEAKEKLVELENKAWDRAAKYGSVNSYKSYLSSYPDGSYVEEAEKNIIDLEVDAIFKGDHGQLPPMSRMPSSSRFTSTNEVEVFNNTNFTLTVRYSGAESRKIVLSPKQRQQFQLKNGSYRVAASVDAAHVQNYAGEENLIGGQYSSEFYIVTTTGYRRY